MKPVRLAKVSLVALIGLYALLVGYNNIVDYGSNYEFVRHLLLMDTTFPGSALRDPNSVKRGRVGRKGRSSEQQ